MKLSAGTVKCPNDGTEMVSNFRAGDRLTEKYEFLESVGSGGMGIIYKAKHLALNQIVAIKLLHPHLLNADTIMRFQREARTASKLRHPNLIQVQDVGTTADGQPFMVMDFASGRSLSDLIREKGRLTVEETLGYFVQICSGLAYAHNQNILHRDLKPSNVMLVKDEHGAVTAKILDFGIAKVLEEGENKGATLTKTGDVFGSPLYMSPEQGAGGNVDRRSDLYSLGCMLYECLTGTTPFMGKSIVETLMAHAQQKPHSLKEATLGLEFPKSLEDVVMKLLAKLPDERYQSVLEVREDLQSIQDSCSTEGQEEVVTKRELRDKAGGESTVFDAKEGKLWQSATGKDITIVLLSVAVAVLIAKDYWVSFDTTQQSRTKVDLANPYPVALEPDLAITNNVVIRKLEEHPSEEYFELRDGDVMDTHLSVLKNNQRLKTLDFQGNMLDGTGLVVAKTIPFLTKLNVSANPLTDRGILVISQLKQLRNLEIKGVELSDLALLHLGEMKGLLKLEMDACTYNVKHLGSLSNMPALEELSLNDQKKLSDRAISLLRQLPNLRMVDVSASKVTGKGFEHPDEYPRLEHICLKENDLTEEGFEVLARLKNLKELDLRLAKFDEQWFKHFRNHPKFAKLKVVGDVDVGRIRRMIPHLQITTD
ncbi:MAG: protein kinase [Candidatus Obscuribacterales bacterium]|nr:protein kinase [Candidatus Obscuribacterales bacterium]